MSIENVAQSILARKLIIPRDWFGDITGLLPYFMLWGATVIVLCFGRDSHSPPFYLLSLCSGAVFFYGIYCLADERSLKVWETGLSISDNKAHVIAALGKLGWTIVENHPQEIKAAISRKWYGFVQQTVTVLIIENALFINVLHQGTHKGRSPFSFGQNEKKLAMLIDAIQAI